MVQHVRSSPELCGIRYRGFQETMTFNLLSTFVTICIDPAIITDVVVMLV